MYSIVIREILSNGETDGILVDGKAQTSAPHIPLEGQWLSILVDETEVIFEVEKVSYLLYESATSLELYVKRLGYKEEAEGTLIRDGEPF